MFFTVNTALDALLADFPPKEEVNSYTVNNWKLSISGDSGFDFLDANDSVNTTGVPAIYVGAGEVCLFSQWVNRSVFGT